MVRSREARKASCIHPGEALSLNMLPHDGCPSSPLPSSTGPGPCSPRMAGQVRASQALQISPHRASSPLQSSGICYSEWHRQDPQTVGLGAAAGPHTGRDRQTCRTHGRSLLNQSVPQPSPWCSRSPCRWKQVGMFTQYHPLVSSAPTPPQGWMTTRPSNLGPPSQFHSASFLPTVPGSLVTPGLIPALPAPWGPSRTSCRRYRSFCPKAS